MDEAKLQTHLEPFYPLIGRIVVGWAIIERQLDEAVVALKTMGHVEDMKNHSLRDRVKALRKAAYNHAQKLGGRTVIDRLTNDILDMAQVRDVIAHGSWSGVNEGPPFAVRFTAMLLVRGGQKQSEVTVSVGALEKLLQQMAKLDSELGIFLTVAVFAAITPTVRPGKP